MFANEIDHVFVGPQHVSSHGASCHVLRSKAKCDSYRRKRINVSNLKSWYISEGHRWGSSTSTRKGIFEVSLFDELGLS